MKILTLKEQTIKKRKNQIIYAIEHFSRSIRPAVPDDQYNKSFRKLVERLDKLSVFF